MKFNLFRDWLKRPVRRQAHFPYPETWVSHQLQSLRRTKLRYLVVACILGLALIWQWVVNGYQQVNGQQTILVLHQSADGVAWVTHLKKIPAATQAATRANLAQYVRLREGFDTASYAYQYRQVNQWSSVKVALQFRREQLASRSDSVIAQLGRTGVRRVRIDAVTLLPFQPAKQGQFGKRQYAEVQFSLQDKQLGSTFKKRKHYRALIAWRYRGLPKNPAVQLSNWMGFEVVYYQKRQAVSQ